MKFSAETSVRNRNVEVAVYFLKAKQGYTIRKMENEYSMY
jgi:hypothetical protein